MSLGAVRMRQHPSAGQTPRPPDRDPRRARSESIKLSRGEGILQSCVCLPAPSKAAGAASASLQARPAAPLPTQLLSMKHVSFHAACGAAASSTVATQGAQHMVCDRGSGRGCAVVTRRSVRRRVINAHACAAYMEALCVTGTPLASYQEYVAVSAVAMAVRLAARGLLAGYCRLVQRLARCRSVAWLGACL